MKRGGLKFFCEIFVKIETFFELSDTTIAESKFLEVQFMKKFKYKVLIIRIIVIAILTACAVFIPSWVADAVMRI